MAVLITGGHGHIASWAARHLARQGLEVILYDLDPRVPDCLTGLEDRTAFVRGNVLDFPRLADTLRRHRGRIDGIIHTVGIMGELVLENPHANVSLNVNGTHNVLEAARVFDIPRVVYTSTGAVYGAVEGVAAESTHRPDPSDLYSATKLASELLGRQYAAAFGFDFRISRVYFCYGPGKLPSSFIRLYRLAFGALEGLGDLRMDSGADQQLDFTHVEDAGRGTAQLYLAENPPHRTYNIATGVASSVGRVAELAARYSPAGTRAELGPGQLMKRCKALNIDRARDELGYRPRWDLEAGIEDYARWMTGRSST